MGSACDGQGGVTVLSADNPLPSRRFAARHTLSTNVNVTLIRHRARPRVQFRRHYCSVVLLSQTARDTHVQELKPMHLVTQLSPRMGPLLHWLRVMRWHAELPLHSICTIDSVARSVDPGPLIVMSLQDPRPVQLISSTDPCALLDRAQIAWHEFMPEQSTRVMAPATPVNVAAGQASMSVQLCQAVARPIDGAAAGAGAAAPLACW